jgi:hypothetical protein
VSAITIDPEFKALIPPLAPEELAQLEANIIKDGCRDPLVLWGETLIDGHNRHEICTRNSIEFETVEMQFTDRAAAMLWMIDNQNGRRNLTDGWKFELAQSKKAILAEKGRGNQGQRTDILSTIDKKLEPHNTRSEIATDLGWSTGKVAMAEQVKKKAPELWEKAKASEVSIFTERIMEAGTRPHHRRP